MVLKNNFGFLDFQDAVNGPITYDLVSLLKDCYVNIPNTYINKNVEICYNWAYDLKLISKDVTLSKFRYWFDLTGLQRHFKCLGIFSRQYIERKCPDYLVHIPRVMSYIEHVLFEYRILFHDFSTFWFKEIVPRFVKKIEFIDKIE